MKKRLNENVLVPGDIALTTTDAPISRKIRKGSWSEVSHAMLYVTHSSIVHAVGDGVHAENTQRIFFEQNIPVYVMRLKEGLSAEDALKICEHVRQIVGSEYSVREAIQAVTRRGHKFSSRQFCSRLIAQAYARYGYPLVNNPNYCTPGDLLKSEMLVRVDDGTRPVSDDEVSFWETQDGGSPEATRVATNHILDGVRKIDPTVQSFSDVGRFIIQHPQHDLAVHQLYVSSGYLDIWKMDFNDHPWRWNLSEMEKLGNRAGVEGYCVSTLKTEPRNDNRFTHSLAAYRQNHRMWPRKTFETLIELYEKLVELHALRVDTATQWLAKHGSNPTA